LHFLKQKSSNIYVSLFSVWDNVQCAESKVLPQIEIELFFRLVGYSMQRSCLLINTDRILRKKNQKKKTSHTLKRTNNNNKVPNITQKMHILAPLPICFSSLLHISAKFKKPKKYLFEKRPARSLSMAQCTSNLPLFMSRFQLMTILSALQATCVPRKTEDVYNKEEKPFASATVGSSLCKATHVSERVRSTMILINDLWSTDLYYLTWRNY
jgi:hypothetical protein